jgi:PAS domain S-box-containing protein
MQKSILTVILAESRPEHARKIRRILKDAGISLRISLAGSPQAALAVLQRRPAGAVVLGLSSPAALDRETVSAIREMAAFAPVVAVADESATATASRLWPEEFTDVLPLDGLTGALAGRALLNAHRHFQTAGRLREREAQLRAVFQQAAMGILMTRISDGRIVYANRSFQQMLAYTEEELLRMSDRRIVHPDDRDADREPWREMVAGKRDWYQTEKRYVGKDRRLVWGRLTVSLSRDGSADDGLAVSMVEDITAHRSMEAALHEAYDEMENRVQERTADLLHANEALHREIDRRKMSEFIIDSVHEFMTLIDKDYRYEAVNNAYCRALGKRPEEIIGRSVADIWGKQRFANRIKPLLDRCLSGVIVHDESWIDLPGRERGYFAMTYYPYSGQTPTAMRAVVITHDLTERKRAEKVLHDARRQQQAILDNIPDMAWLKDGNGSYIAANRVFAEGCGVAQENIPGKTDPDLWPPELAQKYRADDADVMQSGRRKQIEEPIVYKDGHAVWVETIKTPIYDDGGNIMGTAGIARDITERKLSETLLEKERKRLFSLLEELPVFVYLQDRDHSIRFANRFFRTRFGDPRDKKCYQVISKLTDPCPKCLPFKVFESRQHQTWEWLHAPEGRMYQIYDYPFTDTDGSLLVLEMGIDITDFRQAEKRLRIYQEELRSLSSQLTLAEERERRRISCELHDHIGQNLAYCKIKLGELCMDMASGALRSHALEIREIIEQTILYTRTLTCELSPPILYELGLEAAVEWLGDQIIARQGIRFKFEDDGRPKPLSDEVMILLFQSIRELMINIVKHSQAKVATVSISLMHDTVVVAVKDDGAGFDTTGLFAPGNRDAGYGLFSIRERFKNIGGDFHLLSVPGGGSFAMISVPAAKSKKRGKP